MQEKEITFREIKTTLHPQFKMDFQDLFRASLLQYNERAQEGKKNNFVSLKLK